MLRARSKHRLVVTEQPTTDWYKDEKGASNCMIVLGELVDSHARRVAHSNLPLRVLLAYESNERLKDQSLISFLVRALVGSRSPSPSASLCHTHSLVFRLCARLHFFCVALLCVHARTCGPHL